MADDRSLEEEIKIKAQQGKKIARYMSSTEDLVEMEIMKAREAGKFDNLEGAGKPLNLEENPDVPAEMRMAFKILKDNNFAPYWIELGKEIDNDFIKIKENIDSFKRYTAWFYRQQAGKTALSRYQKKQEKFYFEIHLQLENISKKILDYNLHCPSYWQGRANIVPENKMTKVKEEIEKVIEESKANNS